MKKFKIVSSLFASFLLFAAVNVNADVASSYSECNETSGNVCTLKENLVIESDQVITLKSGETLNVPADKSLTIKGTAIVESGATVVIAGEIIVDGGNLDFSKVTYSATTGLVASQGGKLSVSATGNVKMTDDPSWNVWTPTYEEAKKASTPDKTIFGEMEVGATIAIRGYNYVFRGENEDYTKNWTGAVLVGETYYERLEDAVSSAADNSTIKLLGNIETRELITVNKNITIDLNGFNIKNIKNDANTGNVFNLEKGTLNLTGKGIVESSDVAVSGIRVFGANEDKGANYSVLNVGKDVTVKSNTGYSVFVTKNKGTDNKYHAFGAVVNIDGKLDGGYAGFFTNGSNQDTEGNIPIVNINETAVLTGNSGAYIAGYGIYNITGATLTGVSSGLALKSGIYNMKDAIITATGADSTPTAGFSNGINASGAAIQIESNKDYGNAEIYIDGGRYTSNNGVAFYEYLGSVDIEDTRVVNVDIKNATFVPAEGKDKFLVSQEYDAKFRNEVVISSFENGTVTTDKVDYLVGEVVTITVNADDTYELASLTGKVNEKLVDIKDNKFFMPAGNVTLTATFKEIAYDKDIESDPIDRTEKVEEIKVGVTDRNLEEVILKSLEESDLETDGINVVVAVDIEKQDVKDIAKEILDTFDKTIKEKYANSTIAGYFDITLNVVNKDKDANIGKLTELTEDIELTVLLPKELQEVKEGYARKYYVIREHDGKVDILPAVISQDGNSVAFRTAKFSTYALAYEDVVVNTTENPQTFDGLAGNVLLAGLSLVMIVGSVIYLKKKNN